MNEVMSIYSSPGSKICFIYSNNGYQSDIDRAAQYLKVGEIYTVKSTRVGSFHTDVYLKEVPRIAFNSVMFSNMQESATTIQFEIKTCKEYPFNRITRTKRTGYAEDYSCSHKFYGVL